MFARYLAMTCTSLAPLAVLAAPLQEAMIDVKGMDCAACPITIKAVLKKQPGVEEVKVDAQKHTAGVKFDPAKVSPEKLAVVITEAGFPSTVRK